MLDKLSKGINKGQGKDWPFSCGHCSHPSAFFSPIIKDSGGFLHLTQHSTVVGTIKLNEWEYVRKRASMCVS
jgi:hypothetical protein